MSLAGKLFLIAIGLLAVFLLTSCTLPVGIIVADYERFEPPAEWSGLAEEVATCAGSESSGYRHLRWFRTEVVHYSQGQNEHFVSRGALWIEPTDVLLRTDSWDRPEVLEFRVRHELIHVTLGVLDHSDPAFVTCG